MKLSEFAAVLKQIPGTARQPAIAIVALDNWQRITNPDGTQTSGPNAIALDNGDLNLGILRQMCADDLLKRIPGLGKGSERLIREAMFLIDSTDPKVTPKTLHNSDVSGARVNVKDIQVVGNGDLFQLLAKASSQSEGWMKSTKAMETTSGCLVQVTTQQRNPDGSYSVAEALALVPDVTIVPDVNGGRKLVAFAI